MNRSEAIYSALRTDILNWVLPGGCALTMTALSGRFSASRTPVREALVRLERDGLVELAPGRGAVVTRLSRADVEDSYWIRGVLEPAAAARAAEFFHHERFLVLRERLGGFLPVITDEANAMSYYEVIDSLDREIAEASDSRLLARHLELIWSSSKRIRRSALLDLNALAESISEHISIVEAILSGDGSMASSAVAEHLERARERAIRTRRL